MKAIDIRDGEIFSYNGNTYMARTHYRDGIAAKKSNKSGYSTADTHIPNDTDVTLIHGRRAR